MKIVVISHNQREHIAPMLRALSGHEVVCVLDRCTDGSENEDFHCAQVVINSGGSGFLAGRMRDIGAAVHGYEDPILFLDGDKIPSGDLSSIERLPYDAVCLGTNNDKRPFFATGEHGYLPVWERQDFEESFNFFYSCGLYLRPNVMRACMEFSGGRIFHPEFDGHWGEEDRFVCDVMLANRMPMGWCSTVRLSRRITEESEAVAKMGRNFLTRFDLRKKLNY